MQDKQTVTGQKETNPEAILREGCRVLLRWIESWSEPLQIDEQESTACHTLAASQDVNPTSSQSHAISPSDR
jgi:hypothetical protein